MITITDQMVAKVLLGAFCPTDAHPFPSVADYARATTTLAGVFALSLPGTPVEDESTFVGVNNAWWKLWYAQVEALKEPK